MSYTRISADSHIDLPMLVPDLFTSNAQAALKERMPYVIEGPDGPYWTCKNGGSFGLLNGVGPSGQKLVAGQNHRVDVMAATGFYEDGKKGRRRPTDPVLRATDMDRDGVQAEVIFGILGAATRLNDPVAANEMFRIYNDWLVGLLPPNPARFIGLACLPYGDIDAAVKEVHRVAKLGLRGVELSCSWDMEPYVAPDVGAAVEGHPRGRLAAALSHLPGSAAQPAGQGDGTDPSRSILHRGLQLPDESRKHPGRRHRRRRPRALSQRTHLRSVRAALAGFPMHSTAWTSSGRTASATSA